ncbi:tetraacyldisaccharide 4'-kinase [Magnetovibrio sp. PR-2]|uniref:tetraacyldisaccharide 4'-kinase n=1 Tax=Magnetovibrio sp. PR-2 TaxID=3120356 RepID=UPI002FCE1C65
MRGFDFWDRKSNGLLPSLLRPIGCAVAGIAALRQRTAKPWKAPVPVICVGNIVVGGAGKTPVALDLIERLKARGQNVHVVSRGYGGSLVGPERVDLNVHTAKEVGDEPLLLAQKSPTWVSRERRLGIEAAVEQGASLIIMDDGYQNPSVVKDLSLVVTDGGYGFGNGRVMPAGPLREPVEKGLSRADAVILLGADEADVWGRVQRHGYKSLSVIRAQFKPVGDFESLRDKKVFAFAGIGRPEKFYSTLKDIGCNVVETRSFDDHHPYREAEIVSILSDAVDMTVVTTAKDHVRLTPAHQKRIKTVNVELDWKDASEIDGLLDNLLNTCDTPEDDD